MKEIYPGVYAPTRKSDAPAPASKAMRYVNTYSDARFEAWERAREQAELDLKSEVSDYEAQQEAQRLVIEVATKEMLAAREAAQAYRESGLKTLEGAAEFKANAANKQEIFNTSEVNDAAQFVAGEKNNAAMFSVGEKNKAARGAAARAAAGPQIPRGLDKAAVESGLDGLAFTKTEGIPTATRLKTSFDTVDNAANQGAFTKDRQPPSDEQADYTYGQHIARELREGRATLAQYMAAADGIPVDGVLVDDVTADRIERGLNSLRNQSPTSGSGSPGSSAGGGGVGAQGYAPEGATLQGMDVAPILAEQERLALLEDEKALAAERRAQEARAVLEALGYPSTNLVAAQRAAYIRDNRSGQGRIEIVYAALLREEQEKGLKGRAAENSARKRLLAGDLPGPKKNPFDDETLSDAMPARDRTQDPGVREVIDLMDSPAEEDVVPRMSGSSTNPDDEIMFAPTDLSQITQEDTPIEFAPTDLSQITQAPSGLMGADQEALLAILNDDPTEDYLKAGGRLSAPDEADEPEPTPQQVDQAAKIEALLEARTLSRKGNKLRRLTETTEEGRTARDLVRANRDLERPQPLEELRKKIAETYSQDPAKQRRGVVLLYATDMADKGASRQSAVTEADPVIALEGE